MLRYNITARPPRMPKVNELTILLCNLLLWLVMRTMLAHEQGRANNHTISSRLPMRQTLISLTKKDDKMNTKHSSTQRNLSFSFWHENVIRSYENSFPDSFVQISAKSHVQLLEDNITCVSWYCNHCISCFKANFDTRPLIQSRNKRINWHPLLIFHWLIADSRKINQ